MYESYWGLQRKPFEPSEGIQYYYPAAAQRAALLKLRYAIESRRAAVALTGPSGVGKSLLLALLKEQLAENFRPLIQVVFPQMPAADLLAFLATELAGAGRVIPPHHRIEACVRLIHQSLLDNSARGRHAIVAIDEAHLLRSRRTWETLRLLLNLEPTGAVGFTLLLCGQTSLLPALARMPELEERLAMKCVLPAFTLEETISYVNHRMTAVGAPRAIFEPAAVEALHGLSKGLPRRINRLGDLALLVGYAEDRPIITEQQVETVADELAGIRADHGWLHPRDEQVS